MGAGTNRRLGAQNEYEFLYVSERHSITKHSTSAGMKLIPGTGRHFRSPVRAKNFVQNNAIEQLKLLYLVIRCRE